MSECEETYQECMANRKARIERVIAENPDASQAELAKKAAVSLRTIKTYSPPRYETGTKVQRCTFDPTTPETYDPGPDFTPVPQREIDQWVEQWMNWPAPVRKQALAIIYNRGAL